MSQITFSDILDYALSLCQDYGVQYCFDIFSDLHHKKYFSRETHQSYKDDLRIILGNHELSASKYLFPLMILYSWKSGKPDIMLKYCDSILSLQEMSLYYFLYSD